VQSAFTSVIDPNSRPPDIARRPISDMTAPAPLLPD
jgi:hypothetical protein